MSKQDKKRRIRQALASIGYYVRDERGKPLMIVRNQASSQAA